jgi:AraC-like DNA-binding protein
MIRQIGGFEVVMPSSAVQTFSDPDDYATSIRATRSELTVVGRGRFLAKRVRVDLRRLWMQRLSDNLPRIIETVHERGRAIIQFCTQPGSSLFAGGLEMQPTNIVRHSDGDVYHHRSSGFASFAAMSLTVDEMASVGEAVAGFDLTPPSDAMLITPRPAAMARLERLHAAAGYLAENAPEVIANPDAARGLEQILIEAMVDCLGDRQERENSSAQGQHAIVMRRFRRVIEENPEQSLFIPEICKAIRVSGRTLRLCCQEHLGMSPKRYLLLRRMHFVRRDLLAAAPDQTTVTDLATRYGFWQLGRFAVEYRSVFEETPSATLRRQPE